MKPRIVLSICLLSLTLDVRAIGRTAPEGDWISFGDQGGKASAVVRLYQSDGELKGKLLQVFDPAASTCDACPGDQRGKPLAGLEILWGFRKHGGGWDGGKILDPESGRVYSASLELVGDGARLKVRGYVGIALLGRTQIWSRAGS